MITRWICNIVGAILMFVGLESMRIAMLMPIIFAGAYFVLSVVLFACAFGIMYLGYPTTKRHSTPLVN